MNHLIRMFLRIFTRKIMSRGIDAGIDYASGKKTRDPDEHQSPQERARAREAKQSARKAKQAAKLARRLGRF